MAVSKTQNYQRVAASQTDVVLGAAKVGSVLERLVITVGTAATSNVSIKDGNGAAIGITQVNVPIGVYVVDLGIVAQNPTTPGWKVTCGAGVDVLAIGNFNPSTQ